MKSHIDKLVDQAKMQVPAGLPPEEWLKIYHYKFAELVIGNCEEEIKKLRQRVETLEAELLLTKEQ